MARALRGVRDDSGSVGPELSRAWTVGHGTLAADAFVDLLRAFGVEAVVDIRTVPRSRHNPQFNTETMRDWLAAAGIGYEHCKELGGFRRPRADSPNLALRNGAFRGYADYMQTPAFAEALDALAPRLRARPSALMCSESVWWRCHRRLVADYLVLARGWEIFDITHDARAKPHVLTPGVRAAQDGVRYDLPADAGPLFSS